MPNYLGGGTNYVKASDGGLGGGALGAMVNAWSQAKSMEINIAAKKHLMDYSHNLDLERDKHRTVNDIVASGAKTALQNHYDTLLEGVKSGNAMGRINRQGELAGELEQQKHLNLKNRTTQQAGINTRMAKLKHGQNLELGEAKTAQDVKRTREAGRQTRANKKQAAQTDINSMRTLSADLYANHMDPSKGVSPLVANPSNLQNIGPLLKGHPLLAGNEATPKEKPVTTRKKNASKPPVNPPGGASPDSSSGGPTPPVVKPAKVKPAGKGVK